LQDLPNGDKGVLRRTSGRSKVRHFPGGRVGNWSGECAFPAKAIGTMGAPAGDLYLRVVVLETVMSF